MTWKEYFERLQRRNDPSPLKARPSPVPKPSPYFAEMNAQLAAFGRPPANSPAANRGPKRHPQHDEIMAALSAIRSSARFHAANRAEQIQMLVDAVLRIDPNFRF